jgi:tRNA(fMet)-specific endonuclease VapC
MTALCLDTSAYSHFKSGDPAVATVLRGARSVLVPAIVLGELRAGFRFGRKPDVNERALMEFLANPAVEVVPVDEGVASIYAHLMVDLRRAGTPLPTNDVWIAAVARHRAAVVVTYDEHFAAMPGVDARILPSPGASARR